jgi:hypothetical protein
LSLGRIICQSLDRSHGMFWELVDSELRMSNGLLIKNSPLALRPSQFQIVSGNRRWVLVYYSKSAILISF